MSEQEAAGLVEAAEADARALRAALSPLLDRYVALINSGDCGFWNPEEEREVVAARAALASAPAAPDPRDAVVEAAHAAWAEYRDTHSPTFEPAGSAPWRKTDSYTPISGSIQTGTMMALRNALAALDGGGASC